MSINNLMKNIVEFKMPLITVGLFLFYRFAGIEIEKRRFKKWIIRSLSGHFYTEEDVNRKLEELAPDRIVAKLSAISLKAGSYIILTILCFVNIIYILLMDKIFVIKYEIDRHI